MSVLVTVASKHGSTEEIGQAIAEELRSRGVEAEYRPVRDAGDPGEYSAVILGSGVYMGGWLAEAMKFAEQHKAALAAIPVWLFSSGPIGKEDPKPKDDPKQVPGLMEATKARGHRVFGGEVDKRKLGFAERMITRVVGAPEGDFRDWDAIRAWTDEIAASLQVKSEAP